jgi:hypothetical protein
MRNAVVETWDALMDNRINPLRHMEMASQHYFMQVLGCMWSMVFSLTFLSIYHFGIPRRPACLRRRQDRLAIAGAATGAP